MEVADFLSKHAIFTYEEFASFRTGHAQRRAKSLQKILACYAGRGRILHIRRGLYCTVPQGVHPANCPIDPLLLAAKLSNDAILGYHTALEFHGKAHSVHQRFLFLSAAKSTRPFTFRSYRFQAVLFPKKLVEKQKECFGVKHAERSGVDIRVTTLERTLVDVLDRPDLGGGWEEIWRSLESVEFFDLAEVVEYALLLGNATTIAKVGLFLDQHRETLMVGESHLQTLRASRPQRPHYMERDASKKGRFISDWNLVVPIEILERSWEETL